MPNPNDKGAEGAGDVVSRTDLDRVRADPEVRRAMDQIDGESPKMWKVAPRRPAPESEQREHVEVRAPSASAAKKPATEEEEKEKVVVGDRDRFKKLAEDGIDPKQFKRLPRGDRRAMTQLGVGKLAARRAAGTRRVVIVAIAAMLVVLAIALMLRRARDSERGASEPTTAPAHATPQEVPPHDRRAPTAEVAPEEPAPAAASSDTPAASAALASSAPPAGIAPRPGPATKPSAVAKPAPSKDPFGDL